MCSIKDLFDKTSRDILCNTSYPLKKEWFSDYRSYADIMAGEDELSFYFHIAYCKHLCRFCEYTRFLSQSSEEENKYIELIISQCRSFIDTHTINNLVGLDIGGGTPTAINIHAFEKLMSFIHQINQTIPSSKRIERSMEFSFSTFDIEKIKLAVDSGFTRMSTGIQIYDKALLDSNNRDNISVSKMIEYYTQIKTVGVKKMNIDIMYGLPNESFEVIKNTVDAIEIISPEQVTLYETRYNLNKISSEGINRNLLWEQYLYIYNRLLEMGYIGKIGQNSFSKYNDEGVSSYLYNRMFYGKAYKGFGVSAQSMSRKGISYNNLKLCNERNMPYIDRIYEEDIYLLPAEELAAKYVCVSLYSGRFSISVLSEIIKEDAYSVYSDELNFLLDNKLAEINNGICILTQKGFLLYGGVASLFWSKLNREKYMKEN